LLSEKAVAASAYHGYSNHGLRLVIDMIQKLFTVGYAIITVLFVCCAVTLITFAALELVRGINPRTILPVPARLSALLESIGLLTIAVAALELGQTILEEEVQRKVQTSAPTRVRRFLSRFMIVIIVSLSIEALVAIFNFTHEDPARLPHASMIAIAAGVLLASWGIFIKLNRSAEELEPETMEETKQEDHHLTWVSKHRKQDNPVPWLLGNPISFLWRTCSDGTRLGQTRVC
jgi:hypothetical protein